MSKKRSRDRLGKAVMWLEERECINIGNHEVFERLFSIFDFWRVFLLLGISAIL